MRPSWPPPRMPIVPPGAIVRLSSAAIGGFVGWLALDGFGLLGAERVEPLGEPRVGERQDGSRQQRRVDRARLADRQRAHGNAPRHLYDRKQAVEARHGFG